MARSNFENPNCSKFTKNSLLDLIMNSTKELSIENPRGMELNVVVEGRARGRLVGGNLAVLLSSIGSEYEIDLEEKILFFEEIEEETYKVDRMINQLKRLKGFKKLKGIIIGDFAKCEKRNDYSFSLEEVFENNFKGLNIPIISNLKSGQCEPMVTLPLGAMYEIDTKEKSVKILEELVK